MTKFEIVPGKGIGPILLGNSKEEVRKALSLHGFKLESSSDTMDYFCNSGIQVEYEKDGTASFIGTASEHRVNIYYNGVNVFDTPAEELFMLIAKNEEHQCSYDSYEYVFPKQIVTLWDADEQYDSYQNESRLIWGQVGLGSQTYIDAVDKI